MAIKCQPGFLSQMGSDLLRPGSREGDGQLQCLPVGLHWEIFSLALVEPESISEAQHVVSGYYTTTVCSRFH